MAVFIIAIVAFASLYETRLYLSPSTQLSPTPTPSGTLQPSNAVSLTPTQTASPAVTTKPIHKPAATPTPTITPTSITVIDATNKTVAVPFPVKSVITTVGTELIYQLCAGDKIVGRKTLDEDTLAILPASVADIPVMATVNDIIEKKT